MRKCIIATALTLIGLGGAPVNAAFQWDVTPGDGVLFQMKLQNYEVVLDGTPSAFTPYSVADINARKQSGGLIDSVGDELFGIIEITSIEPVGGGTAFWQKSATQSLVGVFSGFRALNTIPLAPGTTTVDFSGGTISVYFDGTPDFDATTGPFTGGWAGIDVSNGVGNAGDVLMVTAAGVDGATAAAGTTLSSSITTTAGGRITGSGLGFFDVLFQLPFDGILFDTGDPFDTLTFSGTAPGSQELKFDNRFDNLRTIPPLTVGFELQAGWSLHSQDPIQAIAQVVPEPTTGLIWTSMAVGAMCCTYRRRRRG